MTVAVLVLSILLANLFVWSVASIINPIAMRMLFGTRQTLASAILHVALVALITLPSIAYAKLSSKGAAE